MKKIKILFVSCWYPANIQRFLAEGLKSIGCDVRLVGQVVTDHYNIKWDDRDIPKIFFEVSKTDPMDLSAIVDKSTVLGFTPDIVILNDWWDFKIERTETRIPFILIEHEGWEANLKRIHEWQPTVAFTGQPYGVHVQPRTEIYTGFKWLPGACLPSVHPFLNYDREFDFVLLAMMYDPRPRICAALEKMGFRIKYGNVPINEYAILHNKALTTYACSNGQEYVKWRVFEAMSMGCLVLSDKFALMEKLFTDGVHYLSIKTDNLPDGRTALNIEDLADKICLCRRNKDLVERITRNAFIEVRAKHTYQDRAKMILSKLGINT